jgi:hypothetical protein
LELQSWWSWRRTGVVVTSLVVALSSTAAAAPRPADAVGDGCVEWAGQHTAARADAGDKHDLNE